jgi:hypothetical protein
MLKVVPANKPVLILFNHWKMIDRTKERLSDYNNTFGIREYKGIEGIDSDTAILVMGTVNDTMSKN